MYLTRNGKTSKNIIGNDEAVMTSTFFTERIHQGKRWQNAVRNVLSFRLRKSWKSNWAHLRTLFEYPLEIRRAIYTTNAIESLNGVIRKATCIRKVFPTDQSAMKVAFLSILNASKKWKRPIHNWKEALNGFSIMFEERVTPYL